MKVDKDVAGYAAAARRHGAATEVGDSTGANEAFLELDRCWKRIRVSSDNWTSSFFELLSDENPWVRLWAASHAIQADAERASSVLEALTSEPGFLGFDAQMTLETWRKGELGERN